MPACPKCGAPLNSTSVVGFCPSCVAAIRPLPAPTIHVLAPVEPVERERLHYFGDYELIEEIARGGMGVVYKARQVSLNRVVALKMILSGALAGAESVKRFHAEAEAAANLKHPNIVAIFEIGEHEGQQYFSMEYIEGRNLAQLVREHPLPSRRAAGYVRTIAEAVHYAHQNGTLHRDLKPSNVIVDARDQPHVMDFGLAKRLGVDSELTLSGQVLGTPSFMSPEQAAGRRKDIHTASDIYSLGALLYHLLTGRPPFAAETLEETLRQVMEVQPAAPRWLNPSTPRDLETICLKCLNKEPARRYGTAAMLAEDLDRWLEGRPILARPVGEAERFWRWCRRHPAVASLTSLVMVLLGAVAIGSTLAAMRIETARTAESIERKRAQVSASAEARERRRAQANELESRERLVRVNLGNGARLMAEGEWHGALLWFSESLRLAESDPVQERLHRFRVGAVLDRCPQLVQLTGHKSAVRFAGFSPDDQQMFTVADEHAVRVWDRSGGESATPALLHQHPIRSVAYHPDGRQILTVSGSEDRSEVMVWNGATGKRHLVLSEATNGVVQAGYSMDGKRLVTAGGKFNEGETRIWDAATGRPLTAILKHKSRVSHAAFSPDGRWLVTASFEPGTGAVGQAFRGDARRGEARVWDAVSGEPVSPVMRQIGELFDVAFSRDGQTVLTASSYEAHIWAASNGRPMTPALRHGKRFLTSAAFSPDGRRLVTTSSDAAADAEGEAQIWDAVTGRAVAPPLRHQGPVHGAAFTPDGRHLVTAAGHGTTGEARVWNVLTGEAESLPMKHGGPVRHAMFNPEGGQVLTASDDGTAAVWDRVISHLPAKVLAHDDFVDDARFALDGRQVITLSGDWSEARVWNTATSRPLTPPLRLKASFGRSKMVPVALSADGQRLVTVEPDNAARVRDTETGQPAGRPIVSQQDLVGASFSPDGEQLWTVASEGDARLCRLWSLRTGEALTDFVRLTNVVIPPVFSPDGRWLAGAMIRKSPGGERRVEMQLVNVRTGRIEIAPVELADVPQQLSFSTDSRSLISLSARGRAQAWDVATGTALGSVRGFDGPVLGLEAPLQSGAAIFDGRKIIAASEERSSSGGSVGARVWDARTGNPLTHLLKHEHVFTGCFSQDGRQAFTLGTAAGADGGTTRVWDAATGEPLAPPFAHRGGARRVAVDGTGEWMLTVLDRRVCLWNFPTNDWPATDLARLAQLLARSRLDRTGSLLPLSQDEYMAGWEELHRRHAKYFSDRRKSNPEWHRVALEEAERQQQWFAALIHLDELIQTAPGEAELRTRRARAQAEWLKQPAAK
jgi:eukaryotic-like serine/threonine-protein kinase